MTLRHLSQTGADNLCRVRNLRPKLLSRGLELDRRRESLGSTLILTRRDQTRIIALSRLDKLRSVPILAPAQLMNEVEAGRST